MNLKNIFRRNSSEAMSSSPEVTESPVLPLPQGSESEDMPVIDQRQSENISYSDRWFERNENRLNADISYMSEYYPNFTLEILDDPESTLNGSLCWHGVLKPQVMDDMEWEIIIVYQGLGGGKGDWAGTMSIYFADPSFEQVTETLGYIPGGFLKDADGAYTLSEHCFGGVRSAIEIANLFCQTVERMCKGEISEDYMEGDTLHLPTLA